MDSQKIAMATAGLLFAFAAYQMIQKKDVSVIIQKGCLDSPWRLYQAVWVDLRPGVYSENAIKFGNQLKEKVQDCVVGG